MESPAPMPETPMETDDSVYPCKGCGEILEEGKAFELAGNRWHIDCFRCNTCGILLDSDANLLLLGDGSLICNNCTYSCTNCGQKIEDLAILTGDLAYCAHCFKCRNCKRKIENLRYAKTSQGIFCMQCHETLMARRRKKARNQQRTSPATSNGNGGPVVLDKSLPALPPNAVSAGAFDGPQIPSESANIQPAADQPEYIMPSNGLFARDPSPVAFEAPKEDPVLTPSSSYEPQQPAASTDEQEIQMFADESVSLPIALDTSPIPHLPPSQPSNERLSASGRYGTSATIRDRIDFEEFVAASSRSTSGDRTQQGARASPQHIASQEKGRQSSSDIAEALRKRETSAPGSGTASPRVAPQSRGTGVSPSKEQQDPLQAEDFKLQEAPKKKTSSKQNSPTIDTSPQTQFSNQTSSSPTLDTSAGTKSSPVDQAQYSRTPFRKSPLSGTPTAPQVERPVREDSMVKTPSSHSVPRKEVPSGEVASKLQDRRTPLVQQGDSSGSVNGKPISKPLEPISRGMPDIPPARSPNRIIPPSREEQIDDFIAPREPPQAPETGHKAGPSVSSIQSENFNNRGTASPPPDPAVAGDGTADDEFGPGSGLFRRVSQAVKHGRSHSDKLATQSPKWARSNRNGSVDISSPTLATPDTKEEGVQLRNKLRFAQQRIAELEAEKNVLEEKVNGTADIRQVNTELREKRSTMAFLDTQREMVVRELEVMTEHLTRAKDTNLPLNLEMLKSEVMRDFAAALSKLKENVAGQIEELMHKKNDLTAEISNLIQMKDKGFQEYESLSTKNAQLVELNNSLVQNIQELYKQGRQPHPGLMAQGSPAANGLGIYTHHNKDRSEVSSLEYRSTVGHDSTISGLSGDTEIEPATVLSAPQIVDIRKGQPKKFNWKKGGQNVAKNVKSGFKGAFSSDKNAPIREEGGFTETAPYGSLHSGDAPITGTTPLAPSRLGTDAARPTWAFLSSQKGGAPVKSSSMGGLTAGVPSVPPETAIFGSELGGRADFEKRVIPSIVTRCVEEVESRGMDMEGIYRKSGSSTLVKVVQQGFERDYANFDISDPDLDIHAITSCLKQYFRKLPVPLLTFDAYDPLLEAAGAPLSNGADKEKIRKVRETIFSLPRTHRDTLEFLLHHLSRVMEKESQNLMTSLNLAVVFAPTIMRPASVEREMTDMQLQRNVIQFLLENSRFIFAPGSGSSSGGGGTVEV